MKLYLSDFSKLREKNDFNQYTPTVKVLDTIQNILLDIQKISNENKLLVSPKKEIVDSKNDSDPTFSKNNLLNHNNSYYKLDTDYDYNKDNESYWDNNTNVKNNDISVFGSPLSKVTEKKTKSLTKSSNINDSFTTNMSTNDLFLNSLKNFTKKKSNLTQRTPEKKIPKTFKKDKIFSQVDTVVNKKRTTRNPNPNHDSPEQIVNKLQRQTFY